MSPFRPNTQYEFSVKVVKGSRESTWSMSVINSTHEAAPASPPRDLTVIQSEDDTSSVTLSWQPPKQPNGQITGYVIFYTTDNTQRERDWVVEGVIGDKLSTALRNLVSDTIYYFKIQARNTKGYGPLSSEVVYKTLPGLANNFLYIIIAAVSGGIVVIILIIIVSVACRRRHNAYLAPVQKNRYGGPKTTSRELKPPDLWIHHDQMELKEKVRQGEHPGLSRSPHETDVMIDVMEKKKGSYIALSATTPVPNGGLESPYEMGSSGLARPIYPRTQYNIPHAHVTIDAAHPGSSSSTLTSPSSRTHHPYDQVTSPTLHITLGGASVLGTGQHATYTSNPNASTAECTSVSGTLSKRPPNHSLKSFSVPAPPCQSAPTTPQPRHIVKPQQVASPQKKLLTGSGPSPATPSSQQSTLKSSRPSTMPRQQEGGSEREDLPPSYSTEDLSVEMANLEGLMKDLNAITASEPEDAQKCNNINFAIEKLRLTNKSICEVEAKIQLIPQFPFCYGPDDLRVAKEELNRWIAERSENLGKGKSTINTLNRNRTIISRETRPDLSYAQALNPLSQPPKLIQMEPLNGETAEATPIIPLTENRKTKNINNPEINQTQTGFTMFDAIQELKSFFQLYPGLVQACEKMSKTQDKNDKLNIFLQGICTQI
ncbi:neogenin [Nephila pilipes]|uniref:Neogenin n=1 Tax=Nephila pilipes TaxID=299642 RepID=A0A8X6TL90_NEPPI|nr:neogenin [Nephila pilipes]